MRGRKLERNIRTNLSHEIVLICNRSDINVAANIE